MGISYIEMNEQKIPIEDEGVRERVPKIEEELALVKGGVGYTSKNLLVYPYTDTTKTVVGVTYTDVGDGTLTLSGTATGSNSFTLVHKNVNAMTLKKGKYILSGCHKGGSDNTYNITINADVNGVSTNIVKEYGDGVEFELEEDTLINYISIAMSSGVNVDGLVFKPMIRYASIEDDTYEPYVASIKSLVCDVEPIQEAVLIDFTSESMFECYRYTATRRCLVHLSATAYYSNSTPKTVRIMKNDDTTTLGVFGISNSNNTQALCTTGFALLEKGENINVQARYFTTGKNNVHLSGYLQYLE